MKQFLWSGVVLALCVGSGLGCGGDDTSGGGGSGGASGKTSSSSGGKTSSSSGGKTSSSSGGKTSSSSGGSSAGKGGSDAGGSSSGPTFSNVYKEIISGSGCNGGSLCHGGMVGNLKMNSKAAAYMALVDVDAMGTNLTPMSGKADCKDSGLKRVVPGDPDNSLIMKKLEGSPPCGDPMPPTGGLSADKIQLVHDWIEAGAKDD
jgi:hypothetical protein